MGEGTYRTVLSSHGALPQELAGIGEGPADVTHRAPYPWSNMGSEIRKRHSCLCLSQSLAIIAAATIQRHLESGNYDWRLA